MYVVYMTSLLTCNSYHVAALVDRLQEFREGRFVYSTHVPWPSLRRYIRGGGFAYS